MPADTQRVSMASAEQNWRRPAEQDGLVESKVDEVNKVESQLQKMTENLLPELIRIPQHKLNNSKIQKLVL